MVDELIIFRSASGRLLGSLHTGLDADRGYLNEAERIGAARTRYYNAGREVELLGSVVMKATERELLMTFAAAGFIEITETIAEGQ